MLKPNYSAYDWKEQGRFQFSRTRSSPELTETSFDLSQGSHGRAIETEKFQNPAKFDSGIRRWNLGSEVMGSHSSKSSLDDYKSTRQTSSQKNLDVASDANSVSNSHQGDIGFTSLEELASVSETLEMRQEEQDLVNMMGSSNIHGLNGLVQFPMHLAPLHLPLTFPTPTGYFKRNLAGAVPSNISFIGPPWGPNMQFAQSLVSFPLSHSNFKDVNESFNDGFSLMQLNTEDNDHGNLHEDDDVSSRGLSPSDSGAQILHLDDKQQKLQRGLTSSHGARSTRSGSLPRGQNKLGRESRSMTREDYNGLFQAKTSRGGDIHSNFRSSNSRFSLSQASSSRSKLAPENPRDRSAANISKPARDKWGRKPASPSVSASYHGKENSGLQFEGSSDNVSLKLDDNSSGWISLSAMGNDTSEKIVESASLASSHARSEHLPGYESAQFQSDPFIPFAPVLVGTSQQRGADYSKMIPMAFVATGPPVPYLVFPFGNFTSNTGNLDGYARQFDKEEESDQFPSSSSCQNIDSMESLNQSEALTSPTVSRDSGPESSAETSSDILNSDLNGHWQNLVYGRICQNSYHEPFVYSSPVVGPPIYPISHFPWDGSGRPLASNLNYTQIMGHGPQLVPVIPLQPGSDQASGVFQHHANEAPRYRGGTGTYLPNPVRFSHFV
ncbi:hypothetical protein BHM03_00002440 [Ensete ventricosum]|uniref:Uncharacterized protein n=1 Tax=Ensete ventricosum TaxID=4639 RepID=A0A445M9M7_ENSVE|nr:hypothetical protein BHM03_00002440 [Ensete ventricosum]